MEEQKEVRPEEKQDSCGDVLKFRTPSALTIAGPSSSGKSSLIRQIFEHLPCMFDTQFKSILWLYGEAEAIPRDLNTHGIPFRTHAGIPAEWSLTELNITAPALIVIEDLIEQAYKSETIMELFTKKIHHLNLTVIFTTQNFFYQSKYSRTITLNTNYVILMRNMRDKAQFSHLARQIEPEHHRELVKAYKEAISRQYGYFLIDMHPASVDALRYRTCILPTDEGCLFWAPPDRIEQLKNGETFELSQA